MRISLELVLLVVGLIFLQQAEGHGRNFTRCQLSRELLRYNFPRGAIAHWVCVIVQSSPTLTTDKRSHHSKENISYTSYGLFQINDKDWCKKGRRGGHCAIKCEDLLNEDLADDVRCAKRIFDRVGFKAWPVTHPCKDKNLPDLSRC